MASATVKQGKRISVKCMHVVGLDFGLLRVINVSLFCPYSQLQKGLQFRCSFKLVGLPSAIRNRSTCFHKGLKILQYSAYGETRWRSEGLKLHP